MELVLLTRLLLESYLTHTERPYSTTERESLAAVRVVPMFRPYILEGCFLCKGTPLVPLALRRLGF